MSYFSYKGKELLMFSVMTLEVDSIDFSALCSGDIFIDWVKFL